MSAAMIIITIRATLIPLMLLFFPCAATTHYGFTTCSISLWFLYLSSESSHLSFLHLLFFLRCLYYLYPQVSPYLLLSGFTFASSFLPSLPLFLIYFHNEVSLYLLSSSWCHISLFSLPLSVSISFLSLFILSWWNKQRPGFDVAPVPRPHGHSMRTCACRFPSLPLQALWW